jgi:hypothetical protein
MAVINERRTRHYPNIVPGISGYDGAGIILVKISNNKFRLERPDELHAPDCVASVFDHKTTRVITLFRAIKSALAKNVSRVDAAVFFELVGFNRINGGSESNTATLKI